MYSSIFLIFLLCFFFYLYVYHLYLHVLTHSFPTRRSSDLVDKSLSASDLHDERVINELLRLSPSIHMTGRVAAEDILLGEHLIKGGSMVIAVLAAANRDPCVFDKPDEIDPYRRRDRKSTRLNSNH